MMPQSRIPDYFYYNLQSVLQQLSLYYLPIQVNINNWRMTNFLAFQQQTPNFHTQQIHDKSTRFHSALREKHIEAYKARVRKQNQCRQNMTRLMQKQPKQLADVLNWCIEVNKQFQNNEGLPFPDLKIIELFKLIEKYPCLEAIELMHCVSHRISTPAIHELFQYDIVGLMHQLIINPEKIVPKVLLARYEQRDKEAVLTQIMKKSILILASLSEQSEKARNFIVMSHKSYLCINKVHNSNKFGSLINDEFIICLYAFTKHPLIYHEQYVRIIKTICLTFCIKFDSLTGKQLILLIKSLTSVVKCKEKWAMDLVEEVMQYDVLDRMLKLMQQTLQRALSQSQQNMTINAQFIELGEIVHRIDIFLMNYMEVTVNQYFDWENFFTQWFIILSIESSCFQLPRRDVYFIFNNIICEADEPQTSFHQIRSLVFQHNCIHVFAQRLDRETNEDVLQQLSYCIHSLFQLKNVQQLSHDIVQSNLVHNCLEATTRNFYAANNITKEVLLSGVLKLLYRTEQREIKVGYAYEVRNYQSKLMQICLQEKENTFEHIVDELMREVANWCA